MSHPVLDRRTERVRRSLLEAAARTWARDASASLTDVAAAAGVGRATLHRHFASRRDLLEALALDAIDRLERTIADCRPDEGTAPEALRRIAAAALPVATEMRFLSLGPEVWALPGLTQRWYDTTAAVEAVVARGQEAGQLRRDLPTVWIADALVGLLLSAADAVADGRLARRDAARLAVDTLLLGVEER